MPRHPVQPVQTGTIWRCLVLLIPAIASACSGDSVSSPAPPPPQPTGTVTGIVRHAKTGELIAGASVSIENAVATSGADGRFQLSNVTAGSATIWCTQAGFNSYRAAVTVTTGTTTHDVSLNLQDAWDVGGGTFLIHVPLDAPHIRGVIATFGGPNTRAFADVNQEFGVPIPNFDAALVEFRTKLRAFALAQGFAILGAPSGFSPVGATSSVLQAISQGAVAAGRPELENAPLVLYGASGGGFPVARVATSQPGRIIGAVLKGPGHFADTFGPEALKVPVLMALQGNDVVVSNTFLRGAFDAARREGGLWTFSIDPNAGHFEFTVWQQNLILNWMSAVIDLRMPANPGEPPVELDESSGWLGNLQTGQVLPWDDYQGDRRAASWIPSESLAGQFEGIIAR